jgi:hypothetical protein
VNALLIPLLESRHGRWLGRRLAVVRYTGRRSGRQRRLVTEYDVIGSTVRIDVGRADAKTWWRNFQSPYPVDLRLAGHDHHLVARVMRDGDLVSVIGELAHAPSARPMPRTP